MHVDPRREGETMTEHFPLLYAGPAGNGPALEVHSPYDGQLIAQCKDVGRDR